MSIVFGNYAKWELKRKGIYWGFIIVVSVISVLFLYETLWFWRWRKNQKTEQENKNLRYENSVMKEYEDTLENQVDVVRKFHHDINKHMDVLNEMVDKTETSEFKVYSDQLEELYQDVKPVTYCSNPIVNAVLVNKMHQCEKKHIKFMIDMMDFESQKMKEIIETYDGMTEIQIENAEIEIFIQIPNK